ncbi:hypothetical protein DP190_09645 [Enterobacter cloacae]|nr:hypothetical protein DP190_09645 [Enterobacter cloacae]
MRIPDRGSTTGAASWTDCERSEQAARTKSKPGFPGLERNSKLSNTLAACAGRAPIARSPLW